MTVPAGAFPRGNVESFVRGIPALIRKQKAVFGSLSYDKYVFFYIKPTSESPAAGGLEHGSSHIALGLNDTLNEGLRWLTAHEYFHLWNPKRIRPAEMWPYDYSEEAKTPNLWVAEGVTSHFAVMTLYRAGLKGHDLPVDWVSANDTTLLLHDLAFRITRVESRTTGAPDGRPDGPLLAWPGDDARVKGQILGSLLDIGILHDTRGRQRLDDVYRRLYAEYYRRGRGYTTRDLERVVSATAGRDYGRFFERHVTGREAPPYDSIFALAGYQLARSQRRLAVIPGLGNAFRTDRGRQVSRVGAGMPAARVGITRGDLIVSLDGTPINELPLVNLYGENWIGGGFVGNAGARVVIRILRDGAPRDVVMALGTREEQRFRIEPMAAPSADQLRVRAAWLRR